MSSDSYAPCPGGTGKKVKFCCPELVAELPKIDRMIEAEQRSACLDYIEGLEKKFPGRVCLLANKALVLGNMGRIDEANNAAGEILASQPQNPVALGEKALLDATSLGVIAALPVLQHAIENSSPSMPPVVYGALHTFAQLLVAAGHLLPARAHALLATGLAREDENALRLMLTIENSHATSLFMKQDPTFDDAPADVPWREKYEAAGKLAARGSWRKSIEQLEDLARRSPAAVPIWRNLALLRGWLADYRGAAEAARHLATLEVSEDDAIEAEAFAQELLALLGEPTITQQLYRIPVSDVERVATTLTAAPHA